LTAFITTICLLNGYRISIRPFSPIQECWPKSPEMARQSAQPALLSLLDCKNILDCFTPLESTPAVRPEGVQLSSVRLAFFDGRSWLYVDQNGLAEYNGRPGVFHVKRWLTLGPKLFPQKNSSSFGSTTRVALSNKTALPLTLIDSTGRVEGEIKPGTSKALDCWWGNHALWIDDSPIASMSRFWSLKQVNGLEVPRNFLSPRMQIVDIRVEDHQIVWGFAHGTSTFWAWQATIQTVGRTPRSKLANVLSKWTGGPFP